MVIVTMRTPIVTMITPKTIRRIIRMRIVRRRIRIRTKRLVAIICVKTVIREINTKYRTYSKRGIVLGSCNISYSEVVGP